MKNLWLVVGTVEKSEYMGDRTKFEDIQLVIADDYDQAVDKYTSFWNDKSREYSTSYFVCDCKAKPAIV